MKVWIYSLVLSLTNALLGQAQYIQLSEGTPFPLKNGYAIPLAAGKQMFQLMESSRTWANTRDSLIRLVNKQRADLRQVQRLADSLKTDNARIKSYTQNELIAQQRQFDEERQQQNEKRKQLEELQQEISIKLLELEERFYFSIDNEKGDTVIKRNSFIEKLKWIFNSH